MTNYHCIFSPCRRYRYVWKHIWGAENPAMFIGLNPSTADESQADPTVRRCIRFAKDWGYDGLIMANLFAWRDTDPRGMKAAEDPVGPENDEWLMRLAAEAGIVVAAWGTHGWYRSRNAQVRGMLGSRLHYLRLTANGFPSHPLYLPADLRPQAWQ